MPVDMSGVISPWVDVAVQLSAWWRSALLCGSDEPGGGRRQQRQSSRATDTHTHTQRVHISRGDRFTVSHQHFSWSSGNKTSGAGIVPPLSDVDYQIIPRTWLLAVDSPGLHLTPIAHRIQVIYSSITGDPLRWVQSQRYLSWFWALWFQRWPATLR